MTLSIRSLAKSYGTFRVLHDVDFTVEPGEVHALLGPNGAGKSTLIKCISGIQGHDTGQISLDGDELRLASPTEAFDAGIATIHQHLSLIDTLSVSDNIFMGRELSRGPLVDLKAQRRKTQELLDRFQIPVRPTTQVGSLPVGYKQLIEIAKAWHRTQVKVLILDEPTSALTEDETLRLFGEIERMKEAGARIVYTTHRLGEIYRIADRITVIRDGRVALSAPTDEVSSREVVHAISGRALAAAEPATGAEARIRDREALVLEGFRGPRFGPIDLRVRAGEIVGLYGVLGSGRSSMLETLAGHFRPDDGRVSIDGNDLGTRWRPPQVIARGLAFVPSDRARQALWGTLSAGDNMLMAAYRALRRGPLRSLARERRAFDHAAERLDLQPPDQQRLGKDYSGGNQQKIVIGRWLQSDDLRVLILDEPTQGVDVGARRKIYDLCHELADRGVAVLFASSDAEEIVRLADRVLVIDQGRQIAEYSGHSITEEVLLSSAHELV